MSEREEMAMAYDSEGRKAESLYDSCCSWTGVDHPGWSKAQMGTAMRESFLAGYDARDAEVKRLREALEFSPCWMIQAAGEPVAHDPSCKRCQALAPADDKSTERGGGA